ncbi:MAG: ABC transporter permease [Actinobacteria bacterium]|nr:ABC transporter permease [Actinomycetota bacterium]
MHTFVGFTITGLVTASIYAIVAGGLTLTYATTGIFNWAHGAFAAIGAFTYWQFTANWHWPPLLALIVSVGLIGPAFGLVVEAVIMRRLDGTSEITRMAVTLALLIGIVSAINWIWDPSTPKVVTAMFADSAVHIVGQRLPVYDLIVVAIALVVGTALWWLLYHRRAGVRMRALVDDRTLLSLHGESPTATARLAWAIGTTTAVLAGVLIAPRTSLSAGGLALLIMNAFAAAVIGRLRSLPMTVVGAVILGLSTAYAQGYIGSNGSFPGWQYLIGLVNVVPAIVLFIALQFLPSERLRASRSQHLRENVPRPGWPGSLVLAGMVVVVTIAMVPLLAPGDLHTATQVWGVALVALSLVPLLGWAGRLSVCPFAFAVIGAMAWAHLTPDGAPWGLLAAAASAAAVAAVLSLLAVRLSPLYLALATAAFAITMDSWVVGLPPFDAVLRIPFTDVTLYRHRVQLFQAGTLSAPRPRIPGIPLSGDTAFFVFASIIFSLVLLMLVALRRSTAGLRMIASKDTAIGFEMVGSNRRTTTVMAFAVSGAIAGLGGALTAAAIERPSSDAFTFLGGLSVVVIVVIFGVASVASAVAAGTIVGAPFLTNLFPSWSQLTSSLTAVAGVGLGDNPNGVIRSGIRPAWESLLRRPGLLAVGIAVVGAGYGATVAGWLTNWELTAVLGVVVVTVPLIARNAERPGTPLGSVGELRDDALSDAPEVLAGSLPLSSDDRRALDALIGVRPDRRTATTR